MLRRKKAYLGLDIGSHTIKMIQIIKNGPLASLKQVVSIPTPKGAYADGELVNPGLIGSMLQRAAQEYNLITKNVISVLPERHVITRQVRLPVMPEEEMASVLSWEVEKYIPLPRKDLVIDFINQGIGEGDAAREMSVLLFAVPQKVVYPYCNMLVESGLTPVALETMPFALHRSLSVPEWVKESGVSNLVTYLDMGASGTTMVILQEGVPEFSRTIPIGGNYITEALAQVFNLDFAGAEKLKLDKAEIFGSDQGEGDMDSDKVQIDLVLRPILIDLAREVRRCMDYWKLKSKGQEISGLYLTGGSGQLKGLSRFMAEQLEAPIKRINPAAFLDGVLKSDTPRELKLKLTPGFSVALGLALREVRP